MDAASALPPGVSLGQVTHSLLATPLSHEYFFLLHGVPCSDAESKCIARALSDGTLQRCADGTVYAQRLPRGVETLAAASCVVMHLHGTASTCLDALDDLERIYWRDDDASPLARAALVCVEYPGYKGAPRRSLAYHPSQFDAAVAAACSVWRELRRSHAAAKIVVSAHSIGTGVAVCSLADGSAARGGGGGDAAAADDVDAASIFEMPSALVLLSPYVSLAQLADNAVAVLDARNLERLIFGSGSRTGGGGTVASRIGNDVGNVVATLERLQLRAAAAQASFPSVFIVCARHDGVTPADHAAEIAEQLGPNCATLHTVEGGHDDVIRTSDAWTPRLDTFAHRKLRFLS